MAQVCSHFRQKDLCPSPPGNLLYSVNERLLDPAYQQPTSELRNYFLGYKEYLETPPSPTASDQGQLFSYFEHSSTDIDEILPISPGTVALQNLPNLESRVKPSTTTNSRTHAKIELQSRKGSQRTRQKRICGRTGSQNLLGDRVAKQYSQSSHRMETRSRTWARRLKELEATSNAVKIDKSRHIVPF